MRVKPAPLLRVFFGPAAGAPGGRTDPSRTREMPLPEEKNRHVWIYEDHDSPVARKGLGACAGIFLLEGRYHVAAHTSPFERRLRERGALHVANLFFEPDPREEAALSGGFRDPHFSDAGHTCRISTARNPLRPGAPSARLGGNP